MKRKFSESRINVDDETWMRGYAAALSTLARRSPSLAATVAEDDGVTWETVRETPGIDANDLVVIERALT